MCRDFARGNCQWKICKFAHVSNGQSHSPRIPTSQIQRPEPLPRRAYGLPNPGKAFRAWQGSILLHTTVTRPSSGRKTTIFQKARQLIKQDASTRQEVIRTLAGEDGLRLVLDLVQENFEDMDSATRDLIFKTQVLPFLQIVSNPEVVSSLVLEQAVGTIYNVLFGINGSRAARWLNFICSVLEIDTTNEGSAMLLEASLHTFSRIADLNSTAPIQDSVHAVAQRFETVFASMNNKNGMSGRLYQSRLHLDRLHQRMETGKSLPTGTLEKKVKKETNVVFIANRETPGGRHNNDFDDICNIKIMPSFEEICSLRAEYLPVNNPLLWHIDGLNGLLDRNFRLLREDTVGQLRDTIHHELSPHAQQSQLRKFVYPKSIVVNLEFNWLSGLYFEVDFPQPAAVTNYTSMARETWWPSSKRLQPGALVCLIIQKNVVLFCTVTHGDMSPRRKKDNILPHDHVPPQNRAEPRTPWKSSTRGSVTLMLVDSQYTNTQVVLDLFSPKKPTMSLVEFPGVILPAFEPALQALQSLKVAQNLPFSELFAPWAFDDFNLSDMAPPSYALEPGFAFDLRCVMKDDTSFYVRVGQPSNMKYVQDHSTLDGAQAHALISYLKRKLALIQGPPGTGKSYTGVALVKVLLANKDAARANLGPILCVTYTNYALDQLLEALLDNNVTSQIVRIGSQSKSERLEESNPQTVAKDTARIKMEKKERWSTAGGLSLCEDDFRALDLNKEVIIARLDSPQAAITSWLDSAAKDSGRP
ncbi:hypothetical protein N7463_010152 [Penicillium fimorum]|uniref:C3H1-type domain-containing protein n=1 Tax=Penicillium fimorum TaxID=1882269 RepID=A0A9X0C1E7_9EURO|nr:hypothetical protein N7463_010152 [Penicillium fimorum]